MRVDSLRAVLAVWLNSFQRSRLGVGKNKSTRRRNVDIYA